MRLIPLQILTSERAILAAYRGGTHRGMKNHALSEAPTQRPAPTNAATPKALTSAGPTAAITDPISAVATRLPVRATALFNPDAAPT